MISLTISSSGSSLSSSFNTIITNERSIERKIKEILVFVFNIQLYCPKEEFHNFMKLTNEKFAN